MIDREKVIKGLEFCSKCCSQNCPYFESDMCIALLANDTLAMLKEQEAVPPIQREVMNLLVWCCGSCGVAITDGDKFCRMCGREVKWDDCKRRHYRENRKSFGTDAQEKHNGNNTKINSRAGGFHAERAGSGNKAAEKTRL